MAGLLAPGPTLAKAEELRSQKGSRGLLEALGTPMSYAPNPVVSMIGSGLLGARYLTGEKPLYEGLASLSDMTAMAVGSMLPPGLRQGALMATKATKAASEYRGQHAAPMRDSGSPLHDLALNKTYPRDVYDMGQSWYGTGEDAMDAVAFGKVRAARGNPDAKVVVWRAIPADAPMELNKGDWVTVSRQYAVDHGNREFGAPHKDWKMVRKEVKAKDIFTNGDSILEWGYDPTD